jgi:hypothetical protein
VRRRAVLKHLASGRLVGASVFTIDGPAVAQITNRDGEQSYNVSCIIPPTEEGGKMQTMEVRVPASGIAKQLQPYTPINFEKLTARFWSVNGRSGLSFSAVSVKPATPKAAS